MNNKIAYNQLGFNVQYPLFIAYKFNFDYFDDKIFLSYNLNEYLKLAY